MRVQKKRRILIIGNPVQTKSSDTFMRKIIGLLYPISEHMYIISGSTLEVSEDRVVFAKINIPFKRFLIISILYQIKTITTIRKLKNKIDVVVLFPEYLLLTLIFLRLLNKRVIFFVGSKPLKTMMLLGKITAMLSDIVVFESTGVMKDWYQQPPPEIIHKAFVLPLSSIINRKTFTVLHPISRRRGICIGYIGRLIPEKGILIFTKAIPRVVETERNIQIIIIGEGPLKTRIVEYLQGINKEKVRVSSWVSHDDLPKVLNQLKLLVIPSFSEGGPNILFESMACGVPVLASKVGAVVDVIIDKKNGFILQETTPDQIAKNIKEILENPKRLYKVSRMGVNTIDYQYNINKINERLSRIFMHTFGM